MTDTETIEPGTTAEQQAAVEAMEPAEAKPTKAAPTKNKCACQFFEVFNPENEDEVFTTGCESDTGSVFAQGHDARLVSFLVDGKADGYQLRHVKDGVSTSFGTPGEAVADISNALQTKAEKAWENRLAKTTAAAERKAARDKLKADKAAAKAKAQADKEAAAAAKKADGPKAVGAEVVAGSGEGSTVELQPGQAVIKVGRWEYVANIDEDGNATYTDGAGAEQVRERDGYQLLRSYEG